jgi:hypothetical protein
LRFISLSLLAFRFATLQATITDNVPVCQSFCLLVIDFPAPRSASLGRQVVKSSPSPDKPSKSAPPEIELA